MNKLSLVIVAASSFGVIFTAIIALAQAQVLFLPYFTPAKIQFHGLNDQYPVNGSMNYEISLVGYGSNCISFTSQILRKESSSTGGDERVAYFSKTDDCRKITISQGAYNYRQNFSYGGHVVLGHPGDYKLKVDVIDEITKQNSTDFRVFTVK